jgi:hypothetical protein
MRSLVLKVIVLSIFFGEFLSASLLCVDNFNDKYTNDTFKKYNYRYKIVAVDTRNWTKNKKDILAKRRILTKFGNALGKKAIVQNLIEKTSKKRAYVTRIQKRLSSNYNLDEAPFLIFFKRERRGYKPYKIISLSSVSIPYLRQKLSQLSVAIHSGTSNKKVYARLEKVRKKVYAKNQKIQANKRAKTTMDKLIGTVKSLFL